LTAAIALLSLVLLPAAAASANPPQDMVKIEAGPFRMGTAGGLPFEGPVHEVKVDAFWIDRHAVTVAAFAAFVKVTGYRTEAEREGWSGVFDIAVGEWKPTRGADWRHPEGPGSKAAADEPVVQVSWDDAVAYASWAGKRLPTEAEWEKAARGGLVGKTYSWGDTLRPGGRYLANFWQGTFPAHNTVADGYLRRAPVGRFPPNGYGLYDMTGNVWEWCADIWDPDYYSRSPRDNPKGAATGTERVIRGGSWMCAENYCRGFRVAARNHTPHDSGLTNLGFRCVRDKAPSR
jgi:formylglycine-generating enzyme required for sulfatase activity